MKKGIEELFLRHGITARIILSYILFVIVPFLIMAMVVVNIFQDYIYSNLGNATMDAMSSAGFQISKEIRKRKEDSMFVYYNDIIEFLCKEERTKEDKDAIEKKISAGMYATEGASGACVVDLQGTVYGKGVYAAIPSRMDIYQEEIMAAGGKCCWYVMDNLYGKASENKYILARSLKSKEGKTVGILYIIMGDSLVTDAFEQLNSDYSVRYLLDEDGNILYCSQEGNNRGHLDITALNPKRISDYQLVKMENGKEAVMASRRIWETGWYCVAVIDMKDMMWSTLKLLRPFGLISVIYVLFLFLMFYMLRRYVFRPLGKLKRSMDQYACGELQAMEIESVGVGELQSLSGHFNSMTVRIENLIQDYREEVEEKNRQRLLTLSAQLTPHFIYNALNTIKWVAVLNHQENVQKLIESLIQIFMNASRVDEEGYTVGDEIRLIENYAVIQKARFMNFDLTIEMEEASSKLRIKKLIIQPIVENAIVHGLGRGKVQNTVIQIKIWADNNLHILVEDHGVGFDVEKWRSSPEHTEGHTNIGISNVEKMIQMEYGEAYGMQIESRAGEGTRVTYLLPVISKED